jgi:hypothetical protein
VAQVQPGTSYSAGDAIAISGDNKISVKVDGTTIGIDSTTKELKSLQSIPTKTSDLQNDSGFITSSSLPTVDQTYDATSANAQSGTAVAGAIAGVKQVPASTSADADKVLTVSSEGVPGWAPAQGGGSTVEAGEGLIKSDDTLSVNIVHDSLLQIGSTILGYANNGVYPVQTSNLASAYFIRTENDSFSMEWSMSNIPSKAYLYIADAANLESASNALKYNDAGFSFDITDNGDQTISIHPSNILLPKAFSRNTATTADGKGSWSNLARSQSLYIMFGFKYNYHYFTFAANNTNNLKYLATDNRLGCTNPIPASTAADATKVLTVDSSGVPGWAQAASGGATWTTTQYTTGATVNQGSIIIPLDDPLPVKAGPNLFAVWFRAQLQNGVSTGNYSIRVTIGTNAYTDAIVYMTNNSTEVYGKVVIAGVWSSVPSTLPQTLSLFPNGAAGGGFVATGTVSATVSLLN